MNRPLEQKSGIFTLDHKTKIMESLSCEIVPLITPEGINKEALDKYLRGESRLDFKLQLPLSKDGDDEYSKVLRDILIKTLDYSKDEDHPLYCRHAFEGHSERSINYVVYSLQRAIHEGKANVTYQDRVVYTGLEYDLPFGGYNKVPRIIISAPSYEKSRKQYLWEEVGEMLKESPQNIKERFILKYAREFNIPFAILVSIACMMSLNDIFNLFNNKQRTKGIYGATKVSQNWGLVVDIYNRLIDIKNNRLYFHRGKFIKVANQVQGSDLSRGLPQSGKHLISTQYDLGRFLHTPQVIFPTLGEYIMRKAPSEFKDPERTNFAIEYSSIIITEPITIFNAYERLPSNPDSPLQDYQIQSINNFLASQTTEG